MSVVDVIEVLVPAPVEVIEVVVAGPQGVPGADGAGVDAHVADAVDAHDASAVSVVPAGNIAATDVQAALVELDAEKATGVALAAEVTNRTDADSAVAAFAVQRANHSGTQAESTVTGLVADLAAKLAAASNLSDVATPATAFANIKQAATDTATGVVELATDAEAVTGTDTVRAVTPANLTGKIDIDGTLAGNLDTRIASQKATKTYADTKAPLACPEAGVNAQTGTTYTLVLGDAGWLITLSNAAAIALSIPTNASVAFPVGTRIDLVQIGAGQVTVAATTPGTTTVLSTGATAASPKCRARYSGMSLVKAAADTWYVFGDIS